LKASYRALKLVVYCIETKFKYAIQYRPIQYNTSIRQYVLGNYERKQWNSERCIENGEFEQGNLQAAENHLDGIGKFRCREEGLKNER